MTSDEARKIADAFVADYEAGRIAGSNVAVLIRAVESLADEVDRLTKENEKLRPPGYVDVEQFYHDEEPMPGEYQHLDALSAIAKKCNAKPPEAIEEPSDLEGDWYDSATEGYSSNSRGMEHDDDQ